MSRSRILRVGGRRERRPGFLPGAPHRQACALPYGRNSEERPCVRAKNGRWRHPGWGEAGGASGKSVERRYVRSHGGTRSGGRIPADAGTDFGFHPNRVVVSTRGREAATLPLRRPGNPAAKPPRGTRPVRQTAVFRRVKDTDERWFGQPSRAEMSVTRHLSGFCSK